MSIYQNIQRELGIINDAVFQDLCDSILYDLFPNHKSFSRIGSATGKQKTKSGNPDTLIELVNGFYIFSEHTTYDRLDKLKSDIKGCFEAAEELGISLPR